MGHTTFTLIIAVVLDHWLGEAPARFHPLVWFGHWSKKIEGCLLHSEASAMVQRIAGTLAVLLALLPCLAWLFWLPLWPLLPVFINVLLVYFCIAARSLQQHALAVHIALAGDDLPLARAQVAKIVSRQTDQLNAIEVRRATIESVLENGADAVFAPLFWFLLLGPFGILLHRLSNTLDAMWGYKNQRYRDFGWFAARLDDVLNWLPARLTALSYALLGNTTSALHAWRTQATLLDSPNAGPVMTAGGGALNLQLGGPARYHGQLKHKPWFGGQHPPENADIERAISLVYRVLGLWLLLIALSASLF